MKSQEITGKYTTVRIEIPKIEFREYKENMESYVDQTEEFDIKIIIRALELCNESRNRLTRFATTPWTWLNEAKFERNEKLNAGI